MNRRSTAHRLRLGIGCITALAVALVGVAVLSLRQMERRFDEVAQDALPVLVQLERVSADAFSLSGPVAALLSNPAGPDTQAEIDEIADRSASLSARISSGQEPLDGAMDALSQRVERLMPHITALQGHDRARRAAEASVPAVFRSTAAGLQEIREALVLAQNSALAAPDRGADERSLLPRLTKTIAELQGLTTALDALERAESVAVYDRALALLQVRSAEFFASLSRIEPLVDTGAFAPTLRAFHSMIRAPEGLDLKRAALAATSEIRASAERLMADARSISDTISGLVRAQQARVERVRSDAVAANARAVVILAVSAALAAALAAAVIYFVVERQLAQRLARLETQAQALRDGDLAPVVPLDGDDDIAALSRAVEGLREMTSMRLDLERGLRDATEEAETLARSKSEFLSMMSHEVRTPLNAIIGIFELIENAEVPERQKTRARHGREVAEGLFELLSKVLDASRLEARRLEARMAETSLPDLVETLDVALGGAARKSGNAVWTRIELDPDLPETLVTDPARLRQVMINLIDNAVRFTPEGDVVLSLRRGSLDGAPSVIFSVQDSGIGIDPADHTRIFEQFRQVDGSMSRAVGGSGLGLAITRKLVDLLGGRITLVSALGEGASFSVEIPLEPRQASALEHRAA
ncbi:ATP-binding protein [Litorisediminicola beolgyonensis]|uniref:histidine kinase n=1 Tax=Litorisediminicola beolgyonensis TaxID=1173614 RepID=A0ABW3ZJI0_9RHOB